jgi:hypothetical protein
MKILQKARHDNSYRSLTHFPDTRLGGYKQGYLLIGAQGRT